MLCFCAFCVTISLFLLGAKEEEEAMKAVLRTIFCILSVLCVAAAVVLVATLVYLIFFDKSGAQKGGVKDGKPFFFGAAVGIAVCAVTWIVTLVSGFAGA